MNDTIHHFFFGIYPYIVITVFIFGSLYRYRHEPYSWNAYSSQLLSDSGLRWGNFLFHIGLFFLMMGHFFGLLTPKEVYSLVVSVETKQLTAMIAGGIAGIVCFTGMTILVIRRLFVERIRRNSRTSDIIILLLIYCVLILGLISIKDSAQHLDGSLMVTMGHWAQHLVTFQSDASSYVKGVPWVFQIHIILALSIFLVFPFTRLVHVFSFPWDYVLRPGYQIVRSRHA